MVREREKGEEGKEKKDGKGEGQLRESEGEKVMSSLKEQRNEPENSDSSGLGASSCSSSSTHCSRGKETKGKKGRREGRRRIEVSFVSSLVPSSSHLPPKSTSRISSLANSNSNPSLSTNLGEISLDPLVPSLLLCDPRPESLLSVLLSEDELEVSGGERLLGQVGDDGSVEGERESVGFGSRKTGSVAERRGKESRSVSFDSFEGQEDEEMIDSRSSLSLEGDLVVGNLELGLSDDVGEVDGEAVRKRRRGRGGRKDGKEVSSRSSSKRSSFEGRKG